MYFLSSFPFLDTCVSSVTWLDSNLKNYEKKVNEITCTVHVLIGRFQTSNLLLLINDQIYYYSVLNEICALICICHAYVMLKHFQHARGKNSSPAHIFVTIFLHQSIYISYRSTVLKHFIVFFMEVVY